MATQIVELTADESKLLRGLQNVIQKNLEWERKLHDLGPTADAAGNAVNDALSKVQASADKALGGMLRDMSKLGPEGQAIANALKDRFREVGGAGIVPINQMLAQLRLIDPAAADAADSARAEFSKLETDKLMQGLLSDLRQVGPEGASAAKALQSHLQLVENSGKDNLDGIIAKVRQLDPEAAAAAEAAAERIRAELGEAARFSEREFGGVLNELRSLGPEGRQVANQLKRELMGAGKVGEKSMEDVIAKLEMLDPVAAKQARKIATSLHNAGGEGEKAFMQLSRTAVLELGSILTSYASVQAISQSITAFLDEQVVKAQKVSELQNEVGKAQQAGIANFASLAEKDIQYLMNDAAPRIAVAIGAPLQSVIDSMGATASSTGTKDPKIIENAVMAAGGIANLSREQLIAASSAAGSISMATGLTAEQSLSLSQSGLGQAKITDAGKANDAFAKLLQVGMTLMPEADKQKSAEELVSLLATTTQLTGDKTGDSSVTSNIKFLSTIDSFYDDFEVRMIEARSEIEILSRRQAKGTATEEDLMKLDNARNFVAAGANVTDPGTWRGRFEHLSQNEALRDRYLEITSFEEAFKQPARQLLTQDSDAQKMLDSAGGIVSADPALYEAQVRRNQTLTPDIATAQAKARTEASMEVARSQSNLGLLDTVQTQLADSLGFSRQKSFEGWGMFSEDMSRKFYRWMFQTDPVQAAATGIEQMQLRVAQLEAGGITLDENAAISQLNQAIDNTVIEMQAARESGRIDPMRLAELQSDFRRRPEAYGELAEANPTMYRFFQSGLGLKMPELEELLRESNQQNRELISQFQLMTNALLAQQEQQQGQAPITTALGAVPQ